MGKADKLTLKRWLDVYWGYDIPDQGDPTTHPIERVLSLMISHKLHQADVLLRQCNPGPLYELTLFCVTYRKQQFEVARRALYIFKNQIDQLPKEEQALATGVARFFEAGYAISGSFEKSLELVGEAIQLFGEERHDLALELATTTRAFFLIYLGQFSEALEIYKSLDIEKIRPEHRTHAVFNQAICISYLGLSDLDDRDDIGSHYQVLRAQNLLWQFRLDEAAQALLKAGYLEKDSPWWYLQQQVMLEISYHKDGFFAPLGELGHGLRFIYEGYWEEALELALDWNKRLEPWLRAYAYVVALAASNYLEQDFSELGLQEPTCHMGAAYLAIILELVPEMPSPIRILAERILANRQTRLN